MGSNEQRPDSSSRARPPGRLLGVHHGPGSWGQSHSLELPADLLEQAVRRLGWVAVLIGGLMLASITFNAIFYFMTGAVPLPPVTVAARLGGAAAAAAMVLVAHSKRLSPQAKTHIGLAYEVVGAIFLISFELTMLPEVGLPFGAISFVAMWVILFRLVVPTTPGEGLVTALLAAATVPVMTRLFRYVGVEGLESADHYFRYFVVFGAAVVSWVASRALYQLGTAVTEARRLGSYQLEELLGRGGMGEVWRGQHAMLKRPAAIKLIDPAKLGVDDSEGREATLRRFEREARATAELRSAHTVTLYDFGVTGDGTFYYVMELLDGVDLDTLVARHGPLPPERVVFLLEQICHSLMDAHARGLIHRDIKPANIFVCCLGPDHDFIKVLDFGLVKDVEHGEEPAATKLTRDGVVTGTPAFMPPEMALGSTPVDARSDVYMVGCVAYWLLTGELVFSGDTAVALISNHIHSEPEPLSSRTKTSVPAPLERIIMDCLAKKPDDRPASAAELRERLAEVELGARWSAAKAADWWRAHRDEPLADDG